MKIIYGKGFAEEELRLQWAPRVTLRLLLEPHSPFTNGLCPTICSQFNPWPEWKLTSLLHSAHAKTRMMPARALIYARVEGVYFLVYPPIQCEFI